MKINECQFCDSKNVTRDRYVGTSFIVMTVLTLGLTLIGIPCPSRPSRVRPASRSLS